MRHHGRPLCVADHASSAFIPLPTLLDVTRSGGLATCRLENGARRNRRRLLGRGRRVGRLRRTPSAAATGSSASCRPRLAATASGPQPIRRRAARPGLRFEDWKRSGSCQHLLRRVTPPCSTLRSALTPCRFERGRAMGSTSGAAAQWGLGGVAFGDGFDGRLAVRQVG
jgi:hypothetical protein